MRVVRKVISWKPIGMVAAMVLSTTAICAQAADQNVTILRLARQWTDPAKDCGGTIWRYHETWQTDVARSDLGALVNVDPDMSRVKAAGGNDKTGPFDLAVAQKVVGSAFAPAGWEQSDFDDGGWTRNPGPFAGWYRSLAAMNLRGKFLVNDPAAVSGMMLDISFQGGAAAYLNGKEIGREGLPAGKITPATLANDYPLEATATPSTATDGLLWQNTYLNDFMPEVYTRDDPSAVKNGLPLDQYKKRFRSLHVSIPAAQLRKGVNVLAIEVRRAAAHSIMFTAPDVKGLIPYGGNWNLAMINRGVGWNRCWIDDIRLRAAANGNAIIPNVSRPDGLQVWNAATVMKVMPTHFGDPNESPKPMRLTGLRNGVFTSQFIVSSTRAITGFKASVSTLKSGDGSSLPESAVRLEFAKWDEYAAAVSAQMGGANGVQFDTLDPIAPTGIPATLSYQDRKPGPFNVAFQPVWLTIRVPRDAKAGDYTGEIVVGAQGESTVKIPVQLRVTGHWALPDPVDFKTMVGMVESPESVAAQYGVKMWSEEHWKLLDEVFALMAEVGVDDLYISLLAKTNLANDESMVRWIKQADGSYKHDLGIVDRYVELASKHLGKKIMVVFWIHDYPFFRGGIESWVGKLMTAEQVEAAKKDGAVPLPCTEIDSATKKTTEMMAPQWGTPEARTFWKPVFDGLAALLAKRGMEKNMYLGCDAQYLDLKCVADCKALAPEARWYRRTHHIYDAKDVGYFNWGSSCATGADVMVVNWTPDESDAGYYRWRTPAWKSSIPTVTGAWSMNQSAELPIFRVAAESILLHKDAPARNSMMVVHGIGSQGADYWPVVTTDIDPRGNKRPNALRQSRLSMYTDQGAVLDQSSATFAYLGRGKAGPTATFHLRLLRQSLQDMEARIFVQDALLDHKDRLGPDLAKRCKDICDERTAQLHHYSNCMMSAYHRIFPRNIFDDGWYQQNTDQLYILTGEVARALGR